MRHARSALVLTGALALGPALPQAAQAAPICVTFALPDSAGIGPCIPYADRVQCTAVPTAAGTLTVCLPVLT
jgi:hypothetical protein